MIFLKSKKDHIYCGMVIGIETDSTWHISMIEVSDHEYKVLWFGLDDPCYIVVCPD